MQEKRWRAALKDLPLGRQYYFDQVGSTNDIAVELLDAGDPAFSFVLADEQLEGRGRNARRWTTLPGAALAFSVILRPGKSIAPEKLGLLSGLGGVAVCRALQKNYALPAKIKWPNDVLINGKKAAGVLAEAHWSGNRLRGVILGIGINVFPASVPPRAEMDFPATSVIAEHGKEISRPELLAGVLAELVDWYPRLNSGGLLRAWEEDLAFRGKRVRLEIGAGVHVEGRALGLNPDGALKLGITPGEEQTFQVGEIHLRPVDISPK